jgi:hypothetical protein
MAFFICQEKFVFSYNSGLDFEHSISSLNHSTLTTSTFLYKSFSSSHHAYQLKITTYFWYLFPKMYQPEYGKQLYNQPPSAAVTGFPVNFNSSASAVYSGATTTAPPLSNPLVEWSTGLCNCCSNVETCNSVPLSLINSANYIMFVAIAIYIQNNYIL